MCCMIGMLLCPPLTLCSPAYFPSSLCWAESGVLLVGKGHLVKVRGGRRGEGWYRYSSLLQVAKVKSDTTDMLDYSGGVEAMTKKKKCMAISEEHAHTLLILLLSL